MHAAALDEGGYPPDCPFSSRRAGKTLETVQSLGMLGVPGARVAAPSAVSREELERFHTPDYLDVLAAAGRGMHDFKALQKGLGTPDCPVFRDMYNYLALAAGGTTHGAQLIIEGDADIAFNPSGGFHHAHPDNASGFCYINDVALAALRFKAAGKKVVIIDVDAHHFDGVQEAFYADPDVTTISLHESGRTLFPGTGAETEIGTGEARGHCINIPLPVGTYDAIFYYAFRKVAVPVIQRLKPDVIIAEIGMDSLAGDPLAHLNLTNNVLADVAGDLSDMNIPLLVTGGGGYNIENTVRGWALVWNSLLHGRDDSVDLTAGLGGVMLENTAWFGGLRDRTLLSHGGYREEVDREIERVVSIIHATVFPLLGI
jgi:acetoin utilization protein AcuC